MDGDKVIQALFDLIAEEGADAVQKRIDARLRPSRDPGRPPRWSPLKLMTLWAEVQIEAHIYRKEHNITRAQFQKKIGPALKAVFANRSLRGKFWMR